MNKPSPGRGVHSFLSGAIVATLVFGTFACSSSLAAELRIALQDADTGDPLQDAVVEVFLPAELQPQYLGTADVSIDQQQKEFVAHVTVVIRGNRANFPNSDDILHHVYSFSPAKVFELPLYSNGENINYSQVFDQSGIVELGCNIHDWMLGYIYVSQSELAVKTDASGQAVITNVPEGEFTVHIWHPRATTDTPEMNPRIVFVDGQQSELRMALTLERDRRLRRAPDAARTRYR